VRVIFRKLDKVMTADRHYWEVQLTNGTVMIGAVRPGLDHNETALPENGESDAYFISGLGGSLHGNGKDGCPYQGDFQARRPHRRFARS
jgi:hypothetical protein